MLSDRCRPGLGARFRRTAIAAVRQLSAKSGQKPCVANHRPSKPQSVQSPFTLGLLARARTCEEIRIEADAAQQAEWGLRTVIFEDVSARRGRLVRGAGLTLGLIVVAAVGLVALSILTPPSLPALPPALQRASLVGEPIVGPLDDGDVAAPAAPSPVTVGADAPAAAAKAAPAAPQSLGGPGFLNSAFVLQGEPRSVASLRAHLANLQVAFPDWLSFADAAGDLTATVDSQLTRDLHAAGVKVLPRLANVDANGVWFENGLGDFLRDDGASGDAFLARLVATLDENKADGVNVDIENLDPEDAGAFVEWLGRVTEALHARGLLVTVDVPMNDEAYDYAGIGRIADAVVLMAYDQHWATSPPGPIAASAWFERGVDAAAQRIPASKLIVGVGAYSYDWADGVTTAEARGFDDTLALADRHDARVEFGDDGNSHFQYVDDARRNHDVWLLDGLSAWNEYHYAQRAAVRGAALWRTGLEEPQLWSFFGAANAGEFDARRLARTPPLDTVRVDGKGELLRVAEGRRDGVRSLGVTKGFIDWAHYDALPRSFTVERFGQATPKQIALTFDDGPNPIWTPRDPTRSGQAWRPGDLLPGRRERHARSRTGAPRG